MSALPPKADIAGVLRARARSMSADVTTLTHLPVAAAQERSHAESRVQDFAARNFHCDAHGLDHCIGPKSRAF
ncbi:MAG: hypothetical protein WB772_20685 [Xanthobacteraceae bacterium]